MALLIGGIAILAIGITILVFGALGYFAVLNAMQMQTCSPTLGSGIMQCGDPNQGLAGLGIGFAMIVGGVVLIAKSRKATPVTTK